MKKFELYVIMILACIITGLIAAAMVKYSWWYTIALMFPLPTLWVSFSIFKIMVTKETKNKTCFLLIGLLAILIFCLIVSMLFIGIDTFFGLSMTLSLFISAISTATLIFNIIYMKNDDSEMITTGEREIEEQQEYGTN